MVLVLHTYYRVYEPKQLQSVMNCLRTILTTLCSKYLTWD